MQSHYYIDLAGLDTILTEDLGKIKIDENDENDILRNYQINLHGFTSENNNDKLTSFLDEIYNMYAAYYSKLESLIKKYNAPRNMFDNFPTCSELIHKFNQLQKDVKENDILNIYLYRDCGQYFVYKEDDILKITLHPSEYGRLFPEKAFKMFYARNVNSCDKIHKLYETIDVFGTTKLTIPITNTYGTICFHLNGVCGGGICLSTKNFRIKKDDGVVCNTKYVFLNFKDTFSDNNSDYENYQYIEVSDLDTGIDVIYYAHIIETKDDYSYA